MGKAQLDELARFGKYFSVPKGVSMWPMLLNRQSVVEIHSLEYQPKRYDVVLYIRGDEQGVIHRVLRRKEDHYIIIGDNCWRLERVPLDHVVGIATRFYRKGYWYSVSDWRYLVYVHLWTDLLFLRRPLFYLRDRMKAWLKRFNRRTTI